MTDPSAPVLVAMSPFKGTLSNVEACEAVVEALKLKNISADMLPVADGGSGTLSAINSVFPGDLIPLSVSDPMGHNIQIPVLCLPDSNAPDTVYLESALMCGYQLVAPEQRDAMRASSHGLGQAINECLKRWEKTLSTIYVGLGDTATSDMGMGMLCALGFRFYDAGGHHIWGNAHGLRLIRSVLLPDLSSLMRVKFVVLCDVMNPLLGPMGAAHTFSRQKGASSSQVHLIEQGMTNLAQLIQDMTGRILRDEPMTGAAGGISAAFVAFFRSELVQGAPFVLNWLKFEQKLAHYKLLITGEGTSDYQTIGGKAPMVCLEVAKKLGIRSLLVSGALGEGYEGILAKTLAVAAVAAGDKPDPKTALHDKTAEVFSDPQFLSLAGLAS